MGSFRIILLVLIVPAVFYANARLLYGMDENWVCNVKKSCLECLRLNQCSWCKTNSRCFSRKLPTFEDFCRDNSTEYQSYGLSFMDNAMCACAGGHLEEDCYPPGVSEGPKCTGRGACICGRCNCNPMPDPEHPTKMVVGDYCEYDNFSCDGPRCNEGPYLHNGSNNIDNSTIVQSDD